jgi:hypothetical protein
VAVAEPKSETRPSGSVAEVKTESPSAPSTETLPDGRVPDPTQRILNDPLVKRAVELFNARVVHVEPWT